MRRSRREHCPLAFWVFARTGSSAGTIEKTNLPPRLNRRIAGLGCKKRDAGFRCPAALKQGRCRDPVFFLSNCLPMPAFRTFRHLERFAQVGKRDGQISGFQGGAMPLTRPLASFEAFLSLKEVRAERKEFHDRKEAHGVKGFGEDRPSGALHPSGQEPRRNRQHGRDDPFAHRKR